LLRRVVARDRAAFRSLYHALRPALIRHLYRLLRRADKVDEVLNDVMWVVWQNAGAFRGDARVTTWVLGIATLKSRRVRAHLQRELERSQSPAVDGDEIGAPSGEFGGPSIDLDRDLADGLARLSTEHRHAIELTYYFGYSCAEVAQLLDCPVGTVKTRLFHARRRLKHYLEECVDYGEVT
jgi:RNA polymerase sigma-70 factor (ECF subfamily)